MSKVLTVPDGKRFAGIGDIILIAALIAVSFLFLIPFVFFGKPVNVSITYEGKTSVYPLSTDTEIVLENIGKVHIVNGEVWMTDSTCPDGICEGFGHISKAGESIVCVPNSVIIKIEGEAEVDGIAG